LLVTWEVFKENGGIQHQITTSAESDQSNEIPKRWPTGRGASDNGRGGADE
jgi:hypothetical protein